MTDQVITEQDQADFEAWCNMQQDIEAGKLEVLKNGGCPKCDGTGFVSHIENAAPMGSGEMWGMDVVNECECWVGKTPHCPACGSDKLEWVEDESDATCQTCGWTSIYQESSGKD